MCYITHNICFVFKYYFLKKIYAHDKNQTQSSREMTNYLTIILYALRDIEI